MNKDHFIFMRWFFIYISNFAARPQILGLGGFLFCVKKESDESGTAGALYNPIV